MLSHFNWSTAPLTILFPLQLFLTSLLIQLTISVRQQLKLAKIDYIEHGKDVNSATRQEWLDINSFDAKSTTIGIIMCIVNLCIITSGQLGSNHNNWIVIVFGAIIFISLASFGFFSSRKVRSCKKELELEHEFDEETDLTSKLVYWQTLNSLVFDWFIFLLWIVY